MPTPLAQILTHRFLSRVSSPEAFQQAKLIDDLRIVDYLPTSIEASVGCDTSTPYTVIIESLENQLIFSCSCPTVSGGPRDWCPQLVAVGLRVSPDTVDQFVPRLDRDALLTRFFAGSTLEDLGKTLIELHANGNLSDDGLTSWAVDHAGTPAEFGAFMYASISDLPDDLFSAIMNTLDGSDPDAVPALATTFGELLDALDNALTTDRGPHLLPAVEQAVKLGCDFATHDTSWTPLLTRALTLHERFCNAYPPSSQRIVTWLDHYIDRIAERLPQHDFGTYSPLIKQQELVAAIENFPKGNDTRILLELLLPGTSQ